MSLSYSRRCWQVLQGVLILSCIYSAWLLQQRIFGFIFNAEKVREAVHAACASLGQMPDQPAPLAFGIKMLQGS